MQIAGFMRICMKFQILFSRKNRKKYHQTKIYHPASNGSLENSHHTRQFVDSTGVQVVQQSFGLREMNTLSREATLSKLYLTLL